MNALTKEFCRERATFVENKCMSIIRSKAMILRNEMRNYTKIFFFTGIHYMQGWKATTKYIVKR